MLRLFRLLSRFGRSADGTTAVEFAIVGPIMIVLLLVGVDTARFVVATERLDDVASTIGQMLSQNSAGYVTDTDLQFYHDSAMVIFPQVLADAQRQGISWSSDIGITMSSVKFTAVGVCPLLCVYVPKVLWSGGTAPRSCTIVLTASANTSGYSLTSLPVGVFQAGNLLVVDVTYAFTPTIAVSFMKSMTISRSFYVSPRFVSQVTYQPGSTAFATNCPVI